MSLSPYSLDSECCVWEVEAECVVSHIAGGEDVGPLEDVLVCGMIEIGEGFVVPLVAILAQTEGFCRRRKVWE